MANSNSLEQSFHLPARTLKALSFCRTDKHSLQEWIGSLPITDASKSTRMLYIAAKEVCELDCAGNIRFDLLCALQPAIHQATAGLQKNFLNQAIILPEQPRKIALLCQTLHQLLSTGFLISACQFSEKMGALLKKPTQPFALAIHHALSEQANILIRDYLLYHTSHDGFWSTTHKLFQLARKYQLHQLKLSFGNLQSTVEQAYIQILLWGCIKANQLRQEDILKIEEPILKWASLVRLGAVDKSKEASFIVDPTLDTPPMYQKFYRGSYAAASACLDTESLTEELKQLTAPLLQKKSGLSANLINHLILAWGVFTGRTFMRLESNSNLTLCVGLSTAHFYLSDKKTFNQFIYGDAPPPKNTTIAGQSEFKAQAQASQKLDVWDQSIYGSTLKSEAQVTMESIDFHIRKGGNSAITLTGTDEEKYQHFDVTVVNMSPGGYCLEWDHNIPHSIKAGEIVCIKEDHHVTWNIGTIRWVRQNKEQSLQLGIELLSPSAIAYGARLADFNGEPKSDFMRVLALPEIKTAGQEACLITPAVSFKSGQYVLLMRHGKQECVELNKLISSSGSYFQFAYKAVKTIAPTEPSGKMMAEKPQTSDADLDSVWGLLD